METLELAVPTATLAHAISGLRTIDHVAVPRSASGRAAQRVVAEHEGMRLSDHDAYVVTLDGMGEVTVG